jgi:peptide/nickel transport system ATP-binding protein
MNSVLSVENLTVGVDGAAGRSPILDNVTFSISPGEAFGIVGESGCGKSTLALALMRYLPQGLKETHGRIHLLGRDLRKLNSAEVRELRSNQVSMVYQDPMASLNPVMKVGAQIAEVLWNQGLRDKRDIQERVKSVLSEVKLPDPGRLVDRYPFQLSGGQQQRVVIAMAMISRPALMIMDEPTTGLDATIEAAILDLVNELRDRFRTAVLFISHNLRAVRQLSDRMAVLYAGRIVEMGGAQEVFTEPRHPYTRGLLAALPSQARSGRRLQSIPGMLQDSHRTIRGCSFFPRCEYGVEGLCTASPIAFLPANDGAEQWVRCVRYKDIEVTQSEGPAVDRKQDCSLDARGTALSVEGLSKEYVLSSMLGRKVGSVRALSNMSMKLETGKTVAVIGESGSGKSTFARILSGLSATDTGSIMLGTADISRLKVERRSPSQLAALQMVFQNPDSTLNPSHTLRFALSRPLRLLRGMTRSQIKEELPKLLSQVNLPEEYLDVRPRKLSGGQKQRAAIARALAARPTVVVADEPVSALDVSVQATVINLLEDLQLDAGISYILISHDVALVEHMADWVVVMYLGRVVEQGPKAEIFQPPYHPYTAAMLTSAFGKTVSGEVVELLNDAGRLSNGGEATDGCPLYSRCPKRIEGTCDVSTPPVQSFARQLEIRCHLNFSQRGTQDLN